MGLIGSLHANILLAQQTSGRHEPKVHADVEHDEGSHRSGTDPFSAQPCALSQAHRCASLHYQHSNVWAHRAGTTSWPCPSLREVSRAEASPAAAGLPCCLARDRKEAWAGLLYPVGQRVRKWLRKKGRRVLNGPRIKRVLWGIHFCLGCLLAGTKADTSQSFTSLLWNLFFLLLPSSPLFFIQFGNLHAVWCQNWSHWHKAQRYLKISGIESKQYILL